MLGTTKSWAWLASGLLVLALGCSTKSGPPAEEDAGGGGVDAGDRVDAPVGDDSGPGEDDAGTVEDGGTDEDAGGDVDAGPDEDAGPDLRCSAESETCDRTEYCDWDGTCGAPGTPGTCEPRPEVCTADCPGVCGCDGEFYCNACVAASAGVDVDPEGDCSPSSLCDPADITVEGACELFFGYAWNGRDCRGYSGCTCRGSDCDSFYETQEECARAHAECAPGSMCGGFGGFICGRSEWCDYEGSCRAPDAAGTCRPRPEACIDIFDPVCGCDGMTYSNGCQANAAGTDVLHGGSCESAGDDCGGVRCGADEFCRRPAGVCSGDGTCSTRPEICPGVFDPVCGCDGTTHSNSCVANSRGVGVRHTGECGAEPPPPDA